MKIRFCQFCGFELPDNAAFCPHCGEALPSAAVSQGQGAVRTPAQSPAQTQGTVQIPAQSPAPTQGTVQIPAQSPAQTQATYSNMPGPMTAQTAPAGSQKKGNTKLILGILAVSVVLIAGIFMSITRPKPLTLNSGDSLELYVGEEAEISLDGSGLTEAEYANTEWSVDNSNVLTIENGTVKASYDSNAFNEVADLSEEGGYSCSCTTEVNAVIKKGIRTWEGSIPVKVSLKPADIKSGELIKKPADTCISTLTVEPSKNYSTYVYLQSGSKKANDMSFVVKKDEKVTVDVPGDHYTMYLASGNTWYGPEYMFGPQTQRSKNNEDWDFSTYTWTLKLDVVDGNLTNENVDEEEFPDL